MTLDSFHLVLLLFSFEVRLEFALFSGFDGTEDEWNEQYTVACLDFEVSWRCVRVYRCVCVCWCVFWANQDNGPT